MISNEVTIAMLSDIAPVVVSLVDLDEIVLDLGGALLTRLNYDRDDFVGRPLAETITDPVVLCVMRRGLAGESATDVTSLKGRPWLVASRPVHSATGAVSGAVTVLTFADVADVHRELTAQETLNEQFAALIEMSADFVSIVDLEGRVTYLNQAGHDMVGLPVDEPGVGRPSGDFVAEEDRFRAHEIEESVRAVGSWQGQSHLRHVGTGEAIPVAVSSFLVNRPSDGSPLALASVQRDLRAQRGTENAMAVRVQEQHAIAELGRLALTMPLADLLQEAVELIAARYPTQGAGVLRRLPGGEYSQMVVSSLPEWTEMLVPIVAESLPGRALLENRVFYTDDLVTDDRFPHDGPSVTLGRRSAMACPIGGGEHPWGTVGASGAEPRHWTDDDVAFVESVAATLGAAVRRDELESRLQHQALHDPLTGLPNRALVMDRIEHALDRSARSDSMVAVLLLDVDDFKAVNDSLGHGRGDELLAQLAMRLEPVVRDGDTVARFGGDEFVVVCEDVVSEDEVAFVAESLLTACGGGIELGGRRLQLSASIGVALSVAGESSTTSMISEADIAMYRAKRDRPGTYRIFDEAMRGEVLGRINVAGELRAAVRAEELTIAYQPIIELDTGRVVAMEALARWTNEAGEPIPPDLFIPVAEETGIIGELGRLMLRGATREAATWQDLGDIGVRVNASAHELRSHAFFEDVMSALSAAGLAPGLLGLEITESVFVDEDKTTQDNFARLRDAGVSLLIDDFGTGYSSLSYLQRFPVVDVLKVDRSFLGEGTRGEAVVQAVIGLGAAFGLQVCAEGVETPEQHARVVELGCDFAQGYLLSRPVPSAQARPLLADWQPIGPPAA